MPAVDEPVGVCTLRAWRDGTADDMRVRITMVDDVRRPAPTERVCASVEEAVRHVEAWLDAFFGDAPVTPQ